MDSCIVEYNRKEEGEGGRDEVEGMHFCVVLLE